LTSPSVAVIIPTYNEESLIEELLENVKQARPDELVVADGSSTDRTASIAERHATVVRTARGRAIQMNTAAATCASEVLLFLHADVRIRPECLKVVRTASGAPGICGGALDIRYEGEDSIARFFTWANRRRRAFGILYGDAGIFCRRRLFEELGGYRPWPILEDYEFGRRLWKRGSLALLAEPIYVSDRRWRQGGVTETLLSWVAIQALYHLGVPPARLARIYRSVR
jgi:rSAM/selenodomain-associated transferase 2